MKKVLAEGLRVLMEAGIDALAEQIKRRRNRHGNSVGMHRGRRSDHRDDLRRNPAGHSDPRDTR